MLRLRVLCRAKRLAAAIMKEQNTKKNEDKDVA